MKTKIDCVVCLSTEVTSDTSSSCRPSSFASSGFVQESALLFFAEQFVSNGQTALLEMRAQQPGGDIVFYKFSFLFFTLLFQYAVLIRKRTYNQLTSHNGV